MSSKERLAIGGCKRLGSLPAIKTNRSLRQGWSQHWNAMYTQVQLLEESNPVYTLEASIQAVILADTDTLTIRKLIWSSGMALGPRCGRLLVLAVLCDGHFGRFIMLQFLGSCGRTTNTNEIACNSTSLHRFVRLHCIRLSLTGRYVCIVKTLGQLVYQTLIMR